MLACHGHLLTLIYGKGAASVDYPKLSQQHVEFVRKTVWSNVLVHVCFVFAFVKWLHLMNLCKTQLLQVQFSKNSD